MDAHIFSFFFFLGRHMTLFCCTIYIKSMGNLSCFDVHIAEECVAIFRHKKNKKLGIILGSSM